VKIHHLDAGPMRPLLVGRLLNDARTLVCHVLAIETPGGDLALVDTGIGLAARRDPGSRFGAVPAALARVPRTPDGAVVSQLAALGRRPEEVRDIFMTHLDYDHASGLSDFPDAAVHVHRSELEAAQAPASGDERRRYVAANWAHGPRWSPFEGEAEFLDGAVVALPMPGHTRGHCAYVVDGSLVHAGDAFYHEATLVADDAPPRGMRVFERVAAVLPELVVGNHERLRSLAADGSRVVCTHDPGLLAQQQRRRTT
jgi:glyoxylase-like metal-dependent hydrolase (beta-lactamase superfamily II)